MDATGDRRERHRRGKALRKSVTRQSHAGSTQPYTRDALAILAESDAERVPALIPERYKRMMADPFAYLRGAAAVMAFDLAFEPCAGVAVQGCGDGHIMNFGAFVSPEDNILFDVNDFDETLPNVDFTVDVKRLAASVAVAALHAGASARRARGLAVDATAAYRGRMTALAALSPLQVWRERIDLEQELKSIVDRALRAKLAGVIARARGAGLDQDDNYPQLVRGADPKIADRPPTIFHLEPGVDDRFDVERIFASYRRTLAPERLRLLERYRLVDFAFKAVGVGSVGTYCYVAMFVSGEGEPLFLQIKQASRSALERLGGNLSFYGPQGLRVVQGQRMMQAASDIFLGPAEDDQANGAFYVRSLKNRRLGGVSEFGETQSLSDYARLCGRTLARAHARSGDAATITGYMGRSGAFDDAIGSFAIAYAGQTALDHAALVKAKGDKTAQPA